MYQDKSIAWINNTTIHLLQNRFVTPDLISKIFPNLLSGKNQIPFPLSHGSNALFGTVLPARIVRFFVLYKIRIHGGTSIR
mmetsp:Transcript_28281/g.32528  ORF Transcript_28281/g.32528 Transcript_28281/m.32528 type:complete len:81 (-) Transcript_28281:88-330(-)